MAQLSYSIRPKPPEVHAVQEYGALETFCGETPARGLVTNSPPKVAIFLTMPGRCEACRVPLLRHRKTVEATNAANHKQQLRKTA